MNPIKLKVTPKTIYADIVDLSDPILLGVTINYFNYSDSTLYFKIVGSGPNSAWSGSTVALGALGSGLNLFKNLDNFFSRIRPNNETTEVAVLTLLGYSDSGYTNLVYTFVRNVTIVFINSNDGSWTQDFLDNFDDGTIDEWAAEILAGDGNISLAINSNYVLSTPYSCRKVRATSSGQFAADRIKKTFTTSVRTTCYAIFNVRVGDNGANLCYHKELKIRINNVSILTLGTPSTLEIQEIPKNKWLRIVVPLTPSSILLLDIFHNVYNIYPATGVFLWLDDFKIISR
jgi:hypothetical protein